MISMSTAKDITETIAAHWCCECEPVPTCENCPYFDDMDPASCSTRLNNDIQYYLHEEKERLQPTREEQPYLPGIEQEFDLSKVKFLPGDYIVLNGIQYTYGIDLAEGIKNGQVSD